MWDTVIAKCPISSECPITRSNTLVNFVKCRNVNTVVDEPVLVSFWNKLSQAENCHYVN